MHRIPLKMKTLSIFWNRSEAECDLFERTLNKANVEETERFLVILDREAIKYRKESYYWALRMFTEIPKKIKSEPVSVSDMCEVINLLTKIILRAPSNSSSFMVALKLRGTIFMQHHVIKKACSDFEMYLSLSDEELTCEDVCEVNGCLTICTYLMRCLNKTKIYYQNYLKYKRYMPDTMRSSESFSVIEDIINSFKNEINAPKNVPPLTAKGNNCITPFRGFNSSSEIPLASSSCYLNHLSKDTKDPFAKGVFTFHDIPKGSIVFVEHSIEIGIHTPLVQCEYCLRRDDIMYTCLRCRYKTYCSIDCMENDRSSHIIECSGYLNIALLVLDAVCLFRVFVRIISSLSTSLFSENNFEAAKTARCVLTILPLEIKRKLMQHDRYMSFVTNRPQYEKLNEVQYATLVSTAFRLTIYLSQNTFVFEKYLKTLKISNKQKLILVGSLLMRLQCHILLNTFDFEYTFPLAGEEIQIIPFKRSNEDIIGPFVERIINDVDAYFAVNPENDLKPFFELVIPADKTIPRSELQNVQHTNPCYSIQRLLSMYKDKITEMCTLSNSQDFLLFKEAATVPTTDLTASMMADCIQIMTDVERQLLLENFASHFHKYFMEYFLHLVQSNKYISQVISSLCTTMGQFRHSCEPNVEVILLENGFIIGKALRQIKSWEELTIAYKANCSRHPRDERRAFLSKINISCKCKVCLTPLEEEPTNLRSGIYCFNCKDEITLAKTKCPNCSTYYTKELLRYRKELKMIENKIECETDDRKMYLLYLSLYTMGRQKFSKFHESCINAELKFAKYLALKNFGQKSYNIIKEVKDRVINAYEEHELWFSFFDTILEVIKILMINNIKRRLLSMPIESLRELCSLGLYILNGQYDYVQFYETFDNYSVKLIRTLKQFLRFKNELICWNSPSIVKLGVSENENEELPPPLFPEKEFIILDEID